MSTFHSRSSNGLVTSAHVGEVTAMSDDKTSYLVTFERPVDLTGSKVVVVDGQMKEDVVVSVAYGYVVVGVVRNMTIHQGVNSLSTFEIEGIVAEMRTAP